MHDGHVIHADAERVAGDVGQRLEAAVQRQGVPRRRVVRGQDDQIARDVQHRDAITHLADEQHDVGPLAPDTGGGAEVRPVGRRVHEGS